MSRYRTEIIIPSDRVVTLHLPDDLPEGRARVTIEVEEADETRGTLDPESDSATDIEWWEEFGDEPTDDEPWGLSSRLSALES